MKNPRIILFALATLFASTAMAQKSKADATSKTNIVVNDNATMTPAIRAKAQKQLNLLFYRINEAQRRNLKSVNTKGILMSASARTNLSRIWSYQHMRLKDNSLNLSVYKFHGKYQFINIPAERFPVSKYEGERLDDGYTELTVDFDKNGQIIDFYISLKNQQYLKLVEGTQKVEEQEKLDQVLYWVNELQNAYNKRDSAFFEQVLDENAIIITGRKKGVIRKAGEIPSMKADRFDYFRQTKKEYIKSLKRIFRSKRDIAIEFSNIDVKKHPSGRYYVVNLNQLWRSTGYNDEGNLFLIWDFKNPDEPQILVRAWSPKDDPKKWSSSDFPLANDGN